VIIAKVDVFPTRLPLRAEFRISRGSVADPAAGAPHVFVRLTTDYGHVGWGEARPSHRWSYETEESVVAALRHYLGPAIIGRSIFDIEAVHQIMDREIAPGLTVGQPIAKSAIDMALHDMQAKLSGQPLSRLFSECPLAKVGLAYLVSSDSPDGAAETAAAAAANGYRGLKVKIGLEPSRDSDIVRAVKEAAPHAYLWVDANQAYDLDRAVELVRALGPLGVDVIEQPLPANDFPGLREVADRTEIPVALDESVWSPQDLTTLISLGAIRALVLKVSKMAGLAPAHRCLQIARESGLLVLGSGLTESPLGMAASLHLYAASDITTPVDLNGPQFLADSPGADMVHIERAVATVPSGPGIGVNIDESALAPFITC
jgi:muconate cycloisomerase